MRRKLLALAVTLFLVGSAAAQDSRQSIPESVRRPESASSINLTDFTAIRGEGRTFNLNASGGFRRSAPRPVLTNLYRTSALIQQQVLEELDPSRAEIRQNEFFGQIAVAIPQILPGAEVVLKTPELPTRVFFAAEEKGKLGKDPVSAIEPEDAPIMGALRYQSFGGGFTAEVAGNLDEISVDLLLSRCRMLFTWMCAQGNLKTAGSSAFDNLYASGELSLEISILFDGKLKLGGFGYSVLGSDARNFKYFRDPVGGMATAEVYWNF